ncbi:MAG TPA: ABC transporter ATP-binding protein [Acidimicrobiales bacterium]|nr:ABC transporter ATP-binding protein [Acidimicrobiales bacterium]
MTDDPAIRVVDLRKRLGTRDVLRGVDFSCRGGRHYALLGPNGAGKTTTLRIVAGLLSCDAGEVVVAGESLATRARAAHRHRIGYVGEDSGLDARLTVREVLRFVAGAYGVRRPDPAIDALGDELHFGEYVERRCGALSKGTRQKVAIARALIHDPAVLLLDEPTANLDVDASLAVETALASDSLRRRTVILSTHRLDEAERLCDSVIGLYEGRVFVEAVIADVAAEASGAPDFRRGFVALLNSQRVGATAL